MPQQQGNKTKHKITPDLILDLYKHTKTMDEPEKQQTVDKIKKLVKYMGDEITVDLNDIKN
mgnify:CR=1 FL=1|jgi:hypothetical protein